MCARYVTTLLLFLASTVLVLLTVTLLSVLSPLWALFVLLIELSIVEEAKHWWVRRVGVREWECDLNVRKRVAEWVRG